MGLLKRLGARLDTAHGRRKMRAFKEGWPGQTTDEIKFYKTAKVQYRYRERQCSQGTGPTIVFTADPPATLEVYDELFAVFSSRFRVIAVELPAMGFSAVSPDYGFGFRETNDDLAEFLRAVAGAEAIWAFSCVAGLAAIDLATRQPDLVSKIILMQTGDVAAFAKWKAARDPKRILAKPVIGQFIMGRIAHKRMPDWYELSVGNRDKIPHFCACAAESFEHGAMWSLASAYQTYMDAGIELGRPSQPILALWGLADRSHPSENAVSALNFSDTVEHVTFDDLGHFSELEDTQRVFKLIEAFAIDSAKPTR
ncbi:MAG: alpha/beta hydrolase [Pseudomonadota bacterium]